MNAMPPEIRPQVNMMRAIHLRAPTRSRNRFDGTSKRKYARKKMPAPKPKAESDSPRSLFMVSAAKLTFTRSRYATKKQIIRKGTSRAVTLAIVRCSSGFMRLLAFLSPRSRSPFVTMLGHELANDAIDVAIGAEAQVQGPADIERARPAADDLHDAFVERHANARPGRRPGHPLQAVEHLPRRHRQPGKVHGPARPQRGRPDTRRMYEV